MKQQRLPEIVSIGFIECSSLPPNMMLQSLAGLVVGISADITHVSFYGEAMLTWEGTKVNGDFQEKSTLQFSTHDIIPSHLNLAFVVTCASGGQYLIGARESRFPVVNYTETTGKRSSDPAVRTYKITHIAQKSVLPCVV